MVHQDNATDQEFERGFMVPGFSLLDCVQLTPQDGPPLCLTWRGDGFEVWVFRIGSSMFLRETPANGEFVCGILIDSPQPMHFCGQWLEPGDCGQYEQGSSHDFTHHPGTITLAVVADRTLAEARGWKLVPIRSHGLVASDYRKLSTICLERLEGDDVARCGCVEGKAVDDAELIDTVFDILDNRRAFEVIRETIDPRHRRLVLTTGDLLDQEDLSSKIQVQELAARLNVSERSLHYAFQACTGTSPYHFILLRRLHHIRKRLLFESPRRGLVTDAAIDAGFENLSRMSRMYRELFGESPRDTLQRRG